MMISTLRKIKAVLRRCYRQFDLVRKWALLKFVPHMADPKKVFCISSQRTGTTSTGKFLADHGLRLATYSVSRNNNWTRAWFNEKYEAIFKSIDFQYYQAFEDDPWWCLEFYKELNWRFPQARFILFVRDSDKWFDSMLRHSKGKTLGNTEIHSTLYNRQDEFRDQFPNHHKLNETDNLLPLTEEHRKHYKEIYEKRNQAVIDYFQKQTNFIHLRLEDNEKWRKLGDFLQFPVNESYRAHENSSKV